VSLFVQPTEPEAADSNSGFEEIREIEIREIEIKEEFECVVP
jgi:hypothetical protein